MNRIQLNMAKRVSPLMSDVNTSLLFIFLGVRMTVCNLDCCQVTHDIISYMIRNSITIYDITMDYNIKADAKCHNSSRHFSLI